MYPGKSQFLIEAYQDATKNPHGYLFIDLKPNTNELLRIRTGILPQDTHYVYLSKLQHEEIQSSENNQDVQTTSNTSTISPIVITK